jgi:hypothetical protein
MGFRPFASVAIGFFGLCNGTFMVDPIAALIPMLR